MKNKINYLFDNLNYELSFDEKNLIYNEYKLILKCQKKWVLICYKLKISQKFTCPLLNYLYECHQFATSICNLGHICFNKQENDLAKKFINTSISIHYLVSLLIKECLNFRKIKYYQDM